MKQLKQDIDDLRSMGYISIARQYGRMARCLKRIQLQRDAEHWDNRSYLRVLAEHAEKALKRFEK